MFFPTPEGNFLAFNVGCPGHFLSKESQELVGEDEHFRAYYVLGRIIEIQVTEPPPQEGGRGGGRRQRGRFFFFRGASTFRRGHVGVLVVCIVRVGSVEDETWFIVSSRDGGTSAWWRRRKCARPGKKKPVEGEVD